MSPVPQRSAQQRAEALAKALRTRQEKAELRAALRQRTVAAVDVVEGSAGNPVWGALRVSWLLEAVPGIGPIKAERLMTQLAIAPSRRLQGLGERQRAALLGELARRA